MHQIERLLNESIFYKKKDPKRALKCLGKAKRYGLLNHRYYEIRTLCYLNLRQFAKAEHSAILFFKKHLNPTLKVKALRLQFEIYMAQDKKFEMLSVAKRAIEIGKGRARDYYNLARYYYSVENYIDAESSISKALSLSSSSLFRGYYAEILRRQGRYEVALMHLSKASSGKRVYSNLLCKAYCYICLGEIENAVDALSEAEAVEANRETISVYNPSLRLENAYLFLARTAQIRGLILSLSTKERVKEAARKVADMPLETIGVYQKKDFKDGLELVHRFI